MQTQHLLRLEIKNEYERRKASIGRYSMSQFAREVGVNRELFYNFMNGRLPFKLKAAMRFKTVIPRAKWRLIQARLESERRGFGSIDDTYYKLPDDYRVKYLSDYDTIRVYVGTALGEFDGTASYLANLFKINIRTVRDRIKFLKKIGLVTGDEGALKHSTVGSVCFDVDDPKFHIKRRRKILKRATQALTKPRTERRYWDLTACIDPADLDRFQTIMDDAVKKFDTEQKRSNPKKVYTFVMGIIPASD